MPTVHDLMCRLEGIAPSSFAASGDNVGLISGDASHGISRVLLALDVTETVAEEAVSLRADAVVSHHPLIYKPLLSVSSETSAGRTLTALIRHNIAAVAAHTNLDAAHGGVNDSLAAALRLARIAPMPSREDVEGAPPLCRAGDLTEAMSADAFCRLASRCLGCGLRYFDAGRPVRRVAVCGGSGGRLWQDALLAGVDALVSGDGFDYNNVVLPALEAGFSLFDAGHFATENVVLPALRDRLREFFPETEFLLARSMTNPYRYYEYGE